jgi:predicted aldo/keto reductase-like oxidoreductase
MHHTDSVVIASTTKHNTKQRKRILMETVRLGKTNLMVSQVGLGGIPLTRPTDDEAVRLIQHCLDLGVNFIDTAFGYGPSEERIGKAIEGRREQVLIATKGGWRQRSFVEHCIEVSLRRLNTEYIDLWQFHNVSTFEAYELMLGPDGAMEAAREALQVGKIGHLGISSHNVDVALEAVSSDLFETVMIPLNFISNEAADKLIQPAREHDVGFLAMKPFAGGRIRDANLAIKYLLQFEGVVPVPGVEKAEEVEEIVGIVNGSWELTPQQRQEMEDIRTRVGTRFCRQCEYCMPCPEGVQIPALMYLPILWELWPPDWFFSWGYVSDAVNSARNCTKCGECEEKCPYSLPIRDMIDENLEFYERVKQQHQTLSGSPSRQ